MTKSDRELDHDRKRQALFEALLAREQVEVSPRESGIPRTTDNIGQLSFAQERMWFLNEFRPESALYNIPMALRLRGELDAAALQHALNEIIQRHEPLRTRVRVIDGQPRQVIEPDVSIDIPVVDLSALPANERDVEYERISKTEARRPFDLSLDPMIRVCLIRLDAREHVLLLVLYHIAFD